MLEVAERMFAEQGIEAVSLRAVGQEAGQRNNSAAQYHFGSRQGLVEAIIETRSRPIEQRRAELVEDLGGDPSVRDLVALFVRPLAETLTHADRSGHYLRFLARVVEHSGVADGLRIAVHPSGLRVMNRLLRERLPDLAPATFERRLRWVAAIGLRTLADLEREVASGSAPATDVVVQDLLAMLEGLVLAPEPAA